MIKNGYLRDINYEVSGFLDDYSKKYICKFNNIDLDISIPNLKDVIGSYYQFFLMEIAMKKNIPLSLASCLN